MESDLLSLGDGHGLAGFPITSQARRFISDIQARKKRCQQFLPCSVGKNQLFSDRYGLFCSCDVFFNLQDPGVTVTLEVGLRAVQSRKPMFQAGLKSIYLSTFDVLD